MLRTVRSCDMRLVSEGDDEFLFSLFSCEGQLELGLPFALVRMQYEAQRRHYRSQFPAAVHNVVLVDGSPAGQLYLDRQLEQLLVVDFSLIPAARRLGVGREIIGVIQAEAASSGKRVTGHVYRANPAVRFWERLGFHLTREDDLYLKMEWRSV